jgi:hypothetical protein
MSAETGVGPSIASGNHICNGNMALLPAPPMNTSNNPQVNALAPRKEEVMAEFSQGESTVVNL